MHHGPFQHIAGHVVGDKSRRKETAVFVAVDFFEDESENRRVDERLTRRGHAALGIACEVVRIEELEDVIQIRERAFCAFAAFVLQDGLVENFHLCIGNAADFQVLFVFGRFEQRTVQVRDIRITLEHVFVAVLDFLAEHLEKENVQFVEVRYFICTHELVRCIALLIHENLRFDKFQEQQAVHPCDAETECHRLAFFLVREIVFELIDGTFKEACLVAICGVLALNEFLVAFVFFYFFEADDVQEFRIKVAVEAVAVVCERLREESLWGEEFVERE